MVIIRPTVAEVKEAPVNCGRNHTWRMIKINHDSLHFKTSPHPAQWFGTMMLTICAKCNKVHGKAKTLTLEDPNAKQTKRHPATVPLHPAQDSASLLHW